MQADIDSLKAAISSAVDVMQAMGSSISSVLSKVRSRPFYFFRPDPNDFM